MKQSQSAKRKKPNCCQLLPKVKNTTRKLSKELHHSSMQLQHISRHDASASSTQASLVIPAAKVKSNCLARSDLPALSILSVCRLNLSAQAGQLLLLKSM